MKILYLLLRLILIYGITEALSLRDFEKQSKSHVQSKKADADQLHTEYIESLIDHSRIKDHTNRLRERVLEGTSEVQQAREKFDIDTFVEDLDKYVCNEKALEDTFYGLIEDKSTELCKESLENNTLKLLGTFNSSTDEFFEDVSNNIYKPLAFDMPRKKRFSEIIKDLIFAGYNDSAIDPETPEQSLHQFESDVLDEFSKIQGLTSHMDLNHKTIADLTVQLLKKFHIHWNKKRLEGKSEEIKGHTKDVMRSILKEYEIKDQHLYEVTQMLVKEIRNAYMRFQKAHKMVNIINDKNHNVIGPLLLKRLTGTYQAIKDNQFTYIKMVHEMSSLCDLQEAYYIENYKNQIMEAENIKQFNDQIVPKVEEIYYEMIKDMKETDELKYIMRDFGASMVLKFKHIEHLIFYYHGITLVVNWTRSIIQTFPGNTVRLYYDLINNLILVPKVCVSILDLKECAFNEINKTLRLLAVRHQLKRSTGGWGLLEYIQDILRLIFVKANDTVFSNWNIFKMFYYQNLFVVLANMKERFIIRNMECVEDLETVIGNEIEHFKNEHMSDHIDFGLIDELDDDLYIVFVNIKADVNKIPQVCSMPSMLTTIQNKLFYKFKHFEATYKKEINQVFYDFMDRLKAVTIKWRDEMLKLPKMEIQVADLPIHAVNLQPQNFHYMGPTDKYSYMNIPQVRAITKPGKGADEVVAHSGVGLTPEGTVGVFRNDKKDELGSNIKNKKYDMGTELKREKIEDSQNYKEAQDTSESKKMDEIELDSELMHMEPGSNSDHVFLDPEETNTEQINEKAGNNEESSFTSSSTDQSDSKERNLSIVAKKANVKGRSSDNENIREKPSLLNE